MIPRNCLKNTPALAAALALPRRFLPVQETVTRKNTRQRRRRQKNRLNIKKYVWKASQRKAGELICPAATTRLSPCWCFFGYMNPFLFPSHRNNLLPKFFNLALSLLVPPVACDNDHTINNSHKAGTISCAADNTCMLLRLLSQYANNTRLILRLVANQEAVHHVAVLPRFHPAVAFVSGDLAVAVAVAAVLGQCGGHVFVIGGAVCGRVTVLHLSRPALVCDDKRKTTGPAILHILHILYCCTGSA